METTFHNVTITIEATTPKEAYTKLCNLLGSRDGVEWMTDFYTVANGDTQASTLELFPDID